MISGGLFLGYIVLLAILMNIALITYSEKYTTKHFNVVSDVIIWVALINIILMVLVDWW